MEISDESVPKCTQGNLHDLWKSFRFYNHEPIVLCTLHTHRIASSWSTWDVTVREFLLKHNLPLVWMWDIVLCCILTLSLCKERSHVNNTIYTMRIFPRRNGWTSFLLYIYYHLPYLGSFIPLNLCGVVITYIYCMGHLSL